MLPHCRSQSDRVVHFCRNVLIPSLILIGLVLLARSAGGDDAGSARAGGERLAAQLRAGEFGPALDNALATPANDRQPQLRRIAAAQRQAGEFAAASATDGYVAGAAPSPPLPGIPSSSGGAQADFDGLIELIKTTIQPDTWDDGGGSGTVKPFESGIRVDPRGVLRQLPRVERNGRLSALAHRARQADLNADMARAAPLRMVSLTRLEKEVAARLAAGQPVLETMQRMAGLTRIQYVFIYPEEREIVIAGPAEGWEYDTEGHAIGSASRRPILMLDDLVVVLRTFTPGGQDIFGCSINPRAENLKALKEFAEAEAAKGPMEPSAVRGWVAKMEKVLGQQDVEIYGIPADSHTARVLVEADYRMKLIGVGKLEGGPHVPNYFDLLGTDRAARQAPMSALRWWLTMKYSSLKHSPDRLAFEIEGPSVQALSENQFVNAAGQHVSTGISEPLNQKFALNLTEHYSEVARLQPVFGELRNIFDQGLVAALLTQEKVPQTIGWDFGVFGRNGAYVVSSLPAPKTVDTVANHRVYNGREVVIQIAGGVRGDLKSVVKNDSLQHVTPELAKVARKGKRPALPANRWWWDAAQ